VIVCTLEKLPPVTQPLLDIDVDYLIMPSASYSDDRHGSLPWCWPSDVVRRLSAAGVSSDLTTIAYSVEGGYTPLQWKYLGDELQARLSDAARHGEILSALQRTSDGAMLEFRGDRIAAERCFLEAGAAVAHAAPWYRLSTLVADEGRTTAARTYFERTVALDTSYYTAYDGGGFWAYQHARWQEAERAFDAVLARDPEHEFALTGLALLAVRRKHWDRAEQFARAALVRNDTLVDAHRALGDALANTGRHRAALLPYDTSLRLALAGHKPILRSLSTDRAGGMPEDPGHASTYERIGEIHARLGESSKANDAFRFAIAFSPRKRPQSSLSRADRRKTSNDRT
jgi:tetratricopeptide (TPR) repeat protein